MEGAATIRVDINCDLGEGFGVYHLGPDEQLLKVVSSANVACGFHAGDPSVMRRTVAIARECGVAIGAHPGYPDLVGFGRREMKAAPREVEDMVIYQIGALAAMAGAEGVRLAHVKAHGALYNQAARDPALAEALARAVRAVDRDLILVGLPGSEILRAGLGAGLRVASEVFADRGYLADGRLAPRGAPGALVTDPAEVARRALLMVREGKVVAVTGEEVGVKADTICVHGDSPGASESAAALRAALQGAGLEVAPMRATASRPGGDD
ncbi:MAG: LamB/YcsF family protein [Bacillota bacterium]